MITVSFCCNNPDNGDALGKVCAIEVHGADVGITLESPSYPDATMTLSVKDGAPADLSRCDSTLRLGRHTYGCRGYKVWFGNWCWDATRMPAVEVRRMLLELREKGWQCTESECDFSDAYANGADLTRELISFALSNEPSPVLKQEVAR